MKEPIITEEMKSREKYRFPFQKKGTIDFGKIGVYPTIDALVEIAESLVEISKGKAADDEN